MPGKPIFRSAARTPRWFRPGRATALVVASTLVVSGSALAIDAASAAGAPAASTVPGPTTLSYTGTEQSYTVPSGVVLLSVRAIGAPGGGTGLGGSGLDLTAHLRVTPGEVLFAEVGQPGTTGGGAGFGGGGAAGSTNAGPSNMNAGSGGGATDVRTCSEAAKNCPGGGTSTESRLVVAGGGGGGGGQGSAVSAMCGVSQTGGNAGSGNGSGGTVVTTSAGTVILASPGATTSPSTPPGGGSDTAPGTGAPAAANCGTGTTSYMGSAGGSSGNASSGGAGGTGVTGTGGGGGGGGGYFGGGGGASGPEGCIMTTCGTFYSGEGAGGGSSFVASPGTLETGTYGNATSAPAVTFTPQIEIDSPAHGATYATGQVVDASWLCNTPTVTGCTGTTPTGQPIQTSPCGPYTYSVTGSIMGQTVGGAVDYNAAMDVTTASLPNATGGQTYRAQLTAACGVTPYTWRRTSGSLPIGLKLKSSGMIMGIPYKKDAQGTYTFAVVAKDSATPRHTATKVLTLVLGH